MKIDTARIARRAAAVAALAIGLAPATASAQAPEWDVLRSLVGEWEGTDATGAPLEASYRLVSGGTALVETLRSPGEPEMITVYHPDGSGVAMTHYCSAGNQPFMRLTGDDAPGLAFETVRVSGPVEPGSGHMQGLVLWRDAEDRLRQRWTHRVGDRLERTTFELRRRAGP